MPLSAVSLYLPAPGMALDLPGAEFVIGYRLRLTSIQAVLSGVGQLRNLCQM